MIAALMLVCAATTATLPPKLVLQSPAERQVFQRDDQGGALVPIVAHSDVASTSKLVALVTASDGSVLATTTLAREGQELSGSVRVPGGGWYGLRIANEGARDTRGLARVERFGVGEVFVVGGQSNSTNMGEERFAALDDRISAFDGESWSLAADPMPGVQDKSEGGSPWPWCGKLLVTALDVPVAFASVGCSGTAIRQWQRDVDLENTRPKVRFYDALAQRVKALGSVRAILWHQGEGDASSRHPQEGYAELIEKLITDLRADTGCNAPWMIANVSYSPTSSADKMERLRTAQQELWKRGIALQGPDTDDLLAGMRAKDGIHFNKRGLEAHGARWFACIYAQLVAHPKLAPVR
jgi:hypothetical protein